MGKTALIAGQGSLVNEAIESLEDPLIITLVDNPEYPYHYKASPGEVGKILKILKKEGVSKVAFIGKVEKKGIFGGYKLDLKAVKILATLKSFRDDEIMNKVVELLRKEDIEVVSQKELLKDLLPEPGLLFGKLSQQMKEDIAFGFEVAKELGRFEIGQTVTVKNRTVITIEAIEGTDETILRAGRYTKDFVVVKVKRPTQNSLMDLPVVGERTLLVAKDAGAKAIAVEAKETLLTKGARDLAPKLGIALVSIDEATAKEWRS